MVLVPMASESIPIAICINAIFSYLADGKRHIICDRLEKGSIFFQEDLKYYTVDELHDTVKVPLHAAKILERSGLLKDPPAPTCMKSNFALNINSVDLCLRVTYEESPLTDMIVCDVYVEFWLCII